MGEAHRSFCRKNMRIFHQSLLGDTSIRRLDTLMGQCAGGLAVPGSRSRLSQRVLASLMVQIFFKHSKIRKRIQKRSPTLRARTNRTHAHVRTEDV